jgi:DNA-binding GntR family transcriptional regulator
MTFDVIDRIRLTRTWREPRALARNVERLRVTNEQHADIVDAIRRHDGREAESAMRRHLLTLHTNLQQSLFGRGAEKEAKSNARTGRPGAKVASTS